MCCSGWEMCFIHRGRQEVRKNGTTLSHIMERNEHRAKKFECFWNSESCVPHYFRPARFCHWVSRWACLRQGVVFKTFPWAKTALIQYKWFGRVFWIPCLRYWRNLSGANVLFFWFFYFLFSIFRVLYRHIQLHFLENIVTLIKNETNKNGRHFTVRILNLTSTLSKPLSGNGPVSVTLFGLRSSIA